MKFGISSLASEGKDIEEFLSFVEDLKIDYFELLFEYPHDYIEKEIFESYSLNYTLHSPISDLNIASTNKAILKASINEIKRSADYIHDIGGNILVVHPGRVGFTQRFFNDYGKEIANNAMIETAIYAKDLGVEICFENMPNFEGFLYQSTDELDNFLKENNLSMTFDIGHKNTIDGKTSSYYKSVKHIHLHDNDKSFDSHLPLGQGVIDFDEFFNMYEKNGYNGIYILELNNKQDILKSIEYLKENKYF
ncbi:sugar phosphate isomerase/epimerase family protein [Methanobrevibacter curvatus]|uniref:Endonuclease 4 n=1 Tax=Methanobrevibacter curvatus TaxID=49547 RepID=A0A165YYB4_9EURY|nr:sugar phosphate isomerase/epimerase family protein [Methanobrevibacter curvatus]KZX10021.1 endonuclease 4 [Methanobrevibacter curvatus]